MELLTGIFSAFGLSASAGLNAYIPLLVVALLARFTDLIKLNHPWDTLTSWWVIGLLVVLSVIEFFADKFPAVNHINDIIQTFVRPAAGRDPFCRERQSDQRCASGAGDGRRHSDRRQRACRQSCRNPPGSHCHHGRCG